MQNKKEPFRFGEKIRQVRERRGYTLKVVASRAGVSESLISQIERNKVSPAIDTLLTITDVLDVNLEYLFCDYRKDKTPVRIINGGERRQIAEDEVLYEEIAKPLESDGAHALESYIITIPKNGTTHRGSYGHSGREFGYILQGKAQLQYETVKYDLVAGDSVSFSASSPHIIVNTGDEELKALWVVTPPQRFL